MASLHVRNVDETIVTRLKERAARNGRSAEAEHRMLLNEALSADPGATFEELAAISRRLTSGMKHTPTDIVLRQSRDEE